MKLSLNEPKLTHWVLVGRRSRLSICLESRVLCCSVLFSTVLYCSSLLVNFLLAHVTSCPENWRHGDVGSTALSFIVRISGTSVANLTTARTTTTTRDGWRCCLNMNWHFLLLSMCLVSGLLFRNLYVLISHPLQQMEFYFPASWVFNFDRNINYFFFKYNFLNTSNSNVTFNMSSIWPVILELVRTHQLAAFSRCNFISLLLVFEISIKT